MTNPYCENCSSAETVEHTFLECAAYMSPRSHFLQDTECLEQRPVTLKDCSRMMNLPLEAVPGSEKFVQNFLQNFCGGRPLFLKMRNSVMQAKNLPLHAKPTPVFFFFSLAHLLLGPFCSNIPNPQQRSMKEIVDR